jgi:acetyltransferase
MTHPAIVNNVAQTTYSRLDFATFSSGKKVSVGGTSPEIRQMTSEDSDMLRGFFNDLSDRSRFSRFMTPISEVSASLLRILSNVGTKNHIAYLASVKSGSHTKMVAEARLVLSDRNSAFSEFAIAVADEWQGKGLASKLMNVIESAARDRGVSVIVGTTLRSNTAMIELARHLGYHLKPDPSEARAVRMVKQISAPHSLH